MLRQNGLPATHTPLRLDPLILNPNRLNLLARRSRLDTMAPIIPTEHDAAFINRLLDAIEHDVVPKTSDGVREGNKLFGAAVLRKSDLSLVAADTNKEMEWPLLHGEVSCLRYAALPLLLVARHSPGTSLFCSVAVRPTAACAPPNECTPRLTLRQDPQLHAGENPPRRQGLRVHRHARAVLSLPVSDHLVRCVLLARLYCLDPGADGSRTSS